MVSPQHFYINGFGYLENIFFNESKCMATIKAVNFSSEDDIYLDCEIHGVLEEYLFALLDEVKKGNTVLVSFSAVYRKFRMAFSVQDIEAETHDEHIVRIDCRLLSISNFFINGSPVDKVSASTVQAENHFQFLTAA